MINLTNISFNDLLKDKHSIPAIYKIENSIDGKVYVGKTRNLFRRMKQHYYDANGKTRKTGKLHLITRSIGMSSFTFSILETVCTPALEQKWIDKLESRRDECGYNCDVALGWAMKKDKSFSENISIDDANKISKAKCGRCKKSWQPRVKSPASCPFCGCRNWKHWCREDKKIIS